MIRVLEVIAVIIGVFFMFVSALGVYRLPDFYTRVHAPTKAATLGLFCLLAAIALDLGEKTVITKAVLALLFIGATAPVGAHLLARAAYRNGIPSAVTPAIDEYAEVVERRKKDPTIEPDHAPDLD